VRGGLFLYLAKLKIGWCHERYERGRGCFYKTKLKNRGFYNR
jgi:hypothetical protein